MKRPRRVLPANVAFDPAWWHRHYGIRFDEPFFFDPSQRMESIRAMKRCLWERFGDLGLGDPDPAPEPCIGTSMVPLAAMVSGIAGCDVRFYRDQAPAAVCADMTGEEILGLERLPLERSEMMQHLRSLAEVYQRRYGHVRGDVNGGVQNLALDLRGPELFIDYYERPHVADHLLGLCARALLELLTWVRETTGTTSLTVTNVVELVDPQLTVTSNCSVAMVSNATYQRFLLQHDATLARHFQPFGIHHCGNNMEHVIAGYSKVPGVRFFEVGWGSDVAACRAAWPDRWLNVRVGPVRLQQATAGEIREEVRGLVEAGLPADRLSVSCMGVGPETPDDNVRAMFEAARM